MPWCVLDNIGHTIHPERDSDGIVEPLPGRWQWICDRHGKAIMEEIVRAVLAEADTRKAKPAEPEPFDYDAYRQKLDATIAGMKRPGDVTVTWDRHSPFPVWAYTDAPQWREGEGNNP